MKRKRKIKEGYTHIKEAKQRKQRTNRILFLELQAYTYAECILAVASSGKVADTEIGLLAKYLWMRSGRGKVTLDEAIQKYSTEL